MRSIIATIAYTIAVTMMVDVDGKGLGRSQCFRDVWACRRAVACSN